jgi:hypothetical protein
MQDSMPWSGRLGRWGLIVAQALFLILIVPAHTRGMIRLTGKAPPPGHAPMFESCCGVNQPSSDDQKPKPLDSSDCALCAIAVALTAAIVLAIFLDHLGVARVRRDWVEPRCGSLAVLRVYQGRGPPAV